MKYILVLGDGMADEPLPEYGGRTPLEVANQPFTDELAGKSELGMVHTIPDGMAPGSDTANLSVLGYDPNRCYTGRSPLEALSIGVDMKETDVAYRCNIVTLTESAATYEEQTIVDHSSGEISTADSTVLLDAVRSELETPEFHFYTGTSYRHLLIWNGGRVLELTQPHDILGKVIGPYLPENQTFRAMMKKSFDILKDHPLNTSRKERGLNPANSIWFWGGGTKPRISSFEELHHKRGVMISAVDLLKGIGIGAGMKIIKVKGANGGLNTNYRGKADAAVDALLKDGYDFAYIHIEAPDEMGHMGKAADKITAIERIDSNVIGVILEAMRKAGEPFRLLYLPDHPTPIARRTHTNEDVPFLLYDSTAKQEHTWHYNEKEGRSSGLRLKSGPMLMERLFR